MAVRRAVLLVIWGVPWLHNLSGKTDADSRGVELVHAGAFGCYHRHFAHSYQTFTSSKRRSA